MRLSGEEIRALVARRRAEKVPDSEARALVDRLIREHAATGRPFSVNTLRPRLRGVRRAIIAPRFAAASRRGEIVRVGSTPSSLPSTAVHHLALWQGAQAGRSRRLPGERGGPDAIT